MTETLRPLGSSSPLKKDSSFFRISCVHSYLENPFKNNIYENYFILSSSIQFNYSPSSRKVISVLSQRPPPGKYDADQFESQWILSYFADYLVPVLVQPEPGHAGGEQTQHSHGGAAKLEETKL